MKVNKRELAESVKQIEPKKEVQKRQRGYSYAVIKNGHNVGVTFSRIEAESWLMDGVEAKKRKDRFWTHFNRVELRG